MNVHLANARSLISKALLPDKTVAGFVNAALDGTGKTSRTKATLQGLGQDAFELAVNPPRALVELGRALFGK